MSYETSGAIDLTQSNIGLDRAGKAREMENPPGPPLRVDGYVIGAPTLIREPPHAGEMHPDGDEILFLISGSLTVILEDQEPARRVDLTPGKALIVPRGVWHRVLLNEPSQLVHMTPGPGGDHRPLEPR